MVVLISHSRVFSSGLTDRTHPYVVLGGGRLSLISVFLAVGCRLDLLIMLVVFRDRRLFLVMTFFLVVLLHLLIFHFILFVVFLIDLLIVDRILLQIFLQIARLLKCG